MSQGISPQGSVCVEKAKQAGRTKPVIVDATPAAKHACIYGNKACRARELENKRFTRLKELENKRFTELENKRFTRLKYENKPCRALNSTAAATCGGLVQRRVREARMRAPAGRWLPLSLTRQAPAGVTGVTRVTGVTGVTCAPLQGGGCLFH